VKKLILPALFLILGSTFLTAQNLDSLQIDQKKRQLKSQQEYSERKDVIKIPPNETNSRSRLFGVDKDARLNENPEMQEKLERIDWNSRLRSSLSLQLLPIVVKGTEITYEYRASNMRSYGATFGYYFNGSDFFSDNDQYWLNEDPYWEGYRFELTFKNYERKPYYIGYKYLIYGVGYKTTNEVSFRRNSNPPNLNSPERIRTSVFASAVYGHAGLGTRQYLKKHIFIDALASLLLVFPVEGKNAEVIELHWLTNRYTFGPSFRLMLSVGFDF
jgi:hypothetical protein